MQRRRTALLAAGALGALGVAWLVFSQRSNDVERVDYETVGQVGTVELRRYPTTVTVETTAPSNRTAFGRLFRYISGDNRAEDSVAMTAPVTTDEGTTGESVAMTAPVTTDEDEEGVRMAFYLPGAYDLETAPVPTDPDVRLVEHPARTLGVLSFSWWATDRRVERKTAALLDALEGSDATVVGEPFLMRYDAPGTPPFLRTNEVAVEVRRTRGP